MRKYIYIFAVCILAIMLSGCSKKEQSPNITAVTPTPLPEVEATDAPDKGGTPTGKPTEGKNIGDNDTNTDNKPSAEPSKAEVTPTDAAATPAPAGDATDTDKPSVTEEPPVTDRPEPSDDPDDSEDGHSTEEQLAVITEYWNNSFLVWLPLYDYGQFAEFSSDETHDYITFEGINIDMASIYVETLRENGFTIDAECFDAEGNELDELPHGSFQYLVSNEDGWRAGLVYDYDQDRYTISSGYDVPEDPDMYGSLREETPLRYIPEFAYGTFDSSMQDQDMYYAVFSDVDEECAAYIEELKNAGFTEEADEGASDGIIWYNAYDKDGRYCDFIYTDGFVRLGCGEE